jgi:hypothetical protein
MNTPPTLATILQQLTTLDAAAGLPRARTARQLAIAMNARANAPALAGAVRAAHWLLMREPQLLVVRSAGLKYEAAFPLEVALRVADALASPVLVCSQAQPADALVRFVLGLRRYGTTKHSSSPATVDLPGRIHQSIVVMMPVAARILVDDTAGLVALELEDTLTAMRGGCGLVIIDDLRLVRAVTKAPLCAIDSERTRRELDALARRTATPILALAPNPPASPRDLHGDPHSRTS